MSVGELRALIFAVFSALLAAAFVVAYVHDHLWGAKIAANSAADAHDEEEDAGKR